jgi:hypothetical protein
MLKKQLVLTALIFWLCVLMINVIRRPVSDNTVLLDALQSEKISWKNRFDLVVAGDSRILLGISPQAMQSILPGYKIGNLGFAALLYSQDYMDYIRNTLNSPYRNRVIVLGFSPRSLLSLRKSACYFRKWYAETRLPLRTELNNYSRWLHSLFRELSAGDLKIHMQKIKRLWLMICLDSGWMASRLFPEDAGRSNPQYKGLFRRNKINEKLFEMICRNTEAWTRERIKVFGIRIPASPGLITIEDKMSGFDERSIRQRFERSGGVWLNPSISYLAAYDGSHLRYDSAVLYSKSLAYELKKFVDKKR